MKHMFQVADAMTLVFTNPLFTLIFELLFFGTKLSVIKGLGGELLKNESISNPRPAP